MTGVLSRTRNRPTLIVGAVLMIVWCRFVLGPDFPLLLAVLATAAGGFWVLRRERDVAACVAIGAGTAVVPAVICVILIDREVSGAADVVVVLTGYILVAPVPALVACTLRPALVHRPINALLGSAVLLLGAVPMVVLGDHGEGAAVLIAALTTSVAVVWYRHRRAAAALLAALPLVNGWTDLGPRTLPDGARIDRLLVGDGQAIACSTSTSTALEEVLLAAARRAAAAAAALGMAGGRVQPVILTDQENACIERHLVNDGKVAASVIVTGQSHLGDVIRLAPRRRGSDRRAVLNGALLPVPTARTVTR